MLHLLWFVILILFAIGCSVAIWLDQAYGSAKPSPLGITLMLLAMLVAGIVKPEILVFFLKWWLQLLPEPGTNLHLVTAVMLTLMTWLAMLLGVVGVGACIAYGWLLWRRKPCWK